MTTSVSRLVITLAATAALTLAGCSSDSDGSGAPASDPSGSASDSADGSTKAGESDTPGLPKGVEGATDVPEDVPNDPDLRGNVTLSSCESASGGWRASGTATNPGTKPAKYTVTVFFTTKAATVIGTGKTRVKVAPGAKEPWRVDDAIKAPDSTLCVLRGVG